MKNEKPKKYVAGDRGENYVDGVGWIL